MRFPVAALRGLGVAAALLASGTATSYGTPPAHGLPPVSAAPDAPIGFPNTTDRIGIGLAFDYRVRNAVSVARNVDYVWGGYSVYSQPPNQPRGNHSDTYVPFDSDAYPQSVRGHTLRDWQKYHPDWIVYRCDRRTPAYYGSGNTDVPLDFTNPAVRGYELDEAAIAFRQGASGVGFDNFSFVNYSGRCGVYRHGRWTQLGYRGGGQDNAKLDRDMIGWLHAMRPLLQQQFPTKTLALNMDFPLVGFRRLREISPYVDLIFNEAGFTSYGQENLTGSEWQKEVRALDYLNASGKAFDVNGIVKAHTEASVTPRQINWVLANYLLVKGPYSYTYIYAGDRSGLTGSHVGYGTFYDRRQYHAPIGYPTSSIRTFRGVAIRFYSGGAALVNPSHSATRTVRLSAAYRDLFGHAHRSVKLPPASGIVLLTP